MSFFSRLIGRMDQMLFHKRLVFREYEQSAEKAMETQYFQSSLRTLKDQFNQLSNEEVITQEEVQNLFKNREEAVARLWDQFIQHHQNDPERVARLRAGQSNILSRLRALKDSVSAQITTLFDPTNTEIIRARHQEQYRRFLETLRSQGLTSIETSETTPAPARRTERLARDRVQQPAEITHPSVERTPQTAQDLFGPDTNRREAARVNPDRQAVSEQFILLARQWRPEINTYFTIAFADKLLSRSDNIPFLKRALGYPDQLKNAVRILYDLYLQTNRTPSRQSIRQFFQQSNSVLAGALQPAIESLIQQLSTQASPEVERELEKATDILPPAEFRQLLERFERSLGRREVPTRADLLEMEKAIRFVQRELLEGQVLRWSDILEARSEASQTVSPSIQVVNRNPLYQLAGKSFEVQRVFSGGETIDYSRTQLNFATHTLEFDLPRFIQTLQDLKREYSWNFSQDSEPASLTGLISQSDQSRENLETRLSIEGYRSMMKTLQFSEANQEYYKNFPRALSDLLEQQTRPSEQRTGLQWLESIRQLQRTPVMEQNPDAYKFLWIVRFLSRTRKIDGSKPFTISQFAQELLKSKTYVVSYDTPPPSFESIRPKPEEMGISTEELSSRATRLDRMTAENDEYLSRIPSFHEIFQFHARFKDVPTAEQINPLVEPWPSAVLKLNFAEQVFLTDPSGRIANSSERMIDPSRIQPSFHPEMIREYHRLKTTNPFFREIVSMGQYTADRNISRNLNLEHFLNYLLTPNSATP